MTTSEELDHKRVQAVYLRKLLENVNEEIAELENVDPYAELKAAHAAGKRIACKVGASEWKIAMEPKWRMNLWQYKIVEDDEEATKYFYFNDSVPHEVRITKCALTGKISAEVVE